MYIQTSSYKCNDSVTQNNQPTQTLKLQHARFISNTSNVSSRQRIPPPPSTRTTTTYIHRHHHFNHYYSKRYSLCLFPCQVRSSSRHRNIIPILHRHALRHMIDLINPHQPLRQLKHVISQADDDELRILGSFFDIGCYDGDLLLFERKGKQISLSERIACDGMRWDWGREESESIVLTFLKSRAASISSMT